MLDHCGAIMSHYFLFMRLMFFCVCFGTNISPVFSKKGKGEDANLMFSLLFFDCAGMSCVMVCFLHDQRVGLYDYLPLTVDVSFQTKYEIDAPLNSNAYLSAEICNF